MQTCPTSNIPQTQIFDVSNTCVFITGASSGIGRYFATTLANSGASVAIAARRYEKLNELADELKEAPGKITALECDVSSQASVKAALDQAETELGSLDVVINNAGIPNTSMALDMSSSEWRNVMSTNLDGPWFVAQEAAQRMIKAQVSGSIINISSILGIGILKRVSAYAITKAALIQMTKALALEWAPHNIRVNAIAPGYIESELNEPFFKSNAGQRLIKSIPQQRLGKAEDLSGALYLLASNASRFMTGSTIVVDGGHLMSMPG